MSQSKLPTDSELAALVRECLPPGIALQAVYIFGTAAAGRLRAESDVDLAFLAPAELDPVSTFQAAQVIATRIGRDVDLIDLRRASTVMRAHIIAEGRRLQCSPKNAVETFEMYALSDYAILQEERRPILEAMEKRYRG